MSSALSALKSGLRALAALTLGGRDPDDFTILIDGVELRNVEAARAIRTMDTAADGWTATLAWNPDDPELSEVLKPYGYKPASVYLGGELIIDGYLYTVENELSKDGVRKNLEGWSATADVIDSTVSPPYEANKITLEKRAKDLCEPLGIGVVFNSKDPDEPFDRVTVEPTETIFEHLNTLAAQRGLLVSSTPQGQLLFTKALTLDTVDPFAPVIPLDFLFSSASIKEGEPTNLSMLARFDGRERFNTYKAIGDTPGKRKRAKKITATATDDRVPASRVLTFSADETTGGNVQAAADWRRSKQLADALTIPFPVPSWYSHVENKLWKENTPVTIESKSLHIPNGFTFMIRSVEYIYENGGTSAILNLVPPNVYTGQQIKEPW
jgi:prophage tail gpP-like protein